jgi:hypothetical protein
VSDVPAPQPGDNLRRILARLRAARRARGGGTPSARELAFEKGAIGEHRLGVALNEAAARRGGCWVLHGLVVPGGRGDIDHLVIGPAGVTVIDCKAWKGKVWIGRLGLGRGRRAFPHEIDGMSRQINRVHSLLAREGRDEVPIEGVICMVNANDGIPRRGFAEIRGVKVGRRRAAIAHAVRDGRLDAITIAGVHRILATEFTAHGGSQAPIDSRPRVRRCVSPVLRKAVLAALAGAAAVIAISAAVNVLSSSVDKLAQPYRPYSRDDLRLDSARLRAIAVGQARGRVRGPKLRVTHSSFVLAYRRGKHCRVVLTVSRAVPALGGGHYSPTATGCSRRRS